MKNLDRVKLADSIAQATCQLSAAENAAQVAAAAKSNNMSDNEFNALNGSVTQLRNIYKSAADLDARAEAAAQAAAKRAAMNGPAAAPAAAPALNIVPPPNSATAPTTPAE